MPRVIHFEIHAENPERAIKFYQGLFGWEFSKWAGPMDYWLVTTGPKEQPGINGGLVRRQGPGPLDMQAINAYACTIDVDNVDVLAGKAAASGGQIVVPRMTIPGVGYLVYCKDTEGNIFGIMQADAGAK
jgi:predicted enzyme related to lactoylglutathione lyase